MKKKPSLWKICLLALLGTAIAGYFWFTRPMTLAELCPQFDWARVTTLDGLYFPINMGDTVHTEDSVSPGEADAREVLALLPQVTLRRDLWSTAQSNFTFLGTKVTPVPEGCPAFDIHLNLRDDKAFLYLQQTGHAITVSYFPFGEGKGRIWGCTLSDGKPLWTALTALIDNHRR